MGKHYKEKYTSNNTVTAMEVAILTSVTKKLSLRTDKHSHPSLDDLKATVF
jgi:hypothetical protein